MLAIPRVSGENNDYVNVLRSFIASQNFMISSEEEVDNDLVVYQTRRSAMVAATGTNENDRLALINFHKMSTRIAPRLEGYSQTLQMKFTWTDAFNPADNFFSRVHDSFYFDWANCLWNLGSAESMLGAQVDRSTEEGIRISCRHFQSAAGIFDYIAKSLMKPMTAARLGISLQKVDKERAVTGSICMESLEMCTHFMLGQAQCCFYEKSVKDNKSGNMKAGTIAKLAYQVASYYEQAMLSGEQASLVRGVAKIWARTAEYHYNLFRGAGLYWQSLADIEKSKNTDRNYGDQVRRLMMSEQALQKALQVSKAADLSSATEAAAVSLLAMVSPALERAADTCRSVYVCAVPREDELTAISPVSMVKPTCGALLFPPAGDTLTQEMKDLDLFKYVIPQEVQSQALALQERADMALRKAALTCGEATNDVRARLGSLGLPGSLEAYKESQNIGGSCGNVSIPDSLWQKLEAINRTQGLSAIYSTLDELEMAAASAGSAIQTVFKALKEEQRFDSAFRRSNSADSNASGGSAEMSSEMLLSEVRAHAERLHSSFQEANLRDQGISASLQEQLSKDGGLGLLSMDRATLQARLPPAPLVDLMNFDNNSGSTAVRTEDSGAPDVRELESALLQLAALVEERQVALGSLETFARSDFVALLLDMDGATPSAMSDAPSIRMENEEREVWKDVDPLAVTVETVYAAGTADACSVIQASTQRQEVLLDAVIQANDAFQASKPTDECSKARDRLIRDVELAIGAHQKLLEDCQQGLGFYKTLVERLQALQSQISDLQLSQKLQREQSSADAQLKVQTAAQMEADRAYAEHIALESNGVEPPKMVPTATTQLQQSTASLGGLTGSPAGSSMVDIRTGQVLPAGSAGFMGGAAKPPPPTYAYPSTPVSVSNAQTAPTIIPSVHLLSNTSDIAGFDQKLVRLCEMGLERGLCVQALVASQGEEQQAIEMVLSGSIPPPPAASNNYNNNNALSRQTGQGQPEPLIRRNPQNNANSPQTEVYQVQVPPSVGSGQFFVCNVNGQDFQVRCPDDKRAGDHIRISVPKLAMRVHASQEQEQPKKANGLFGWGR